MRRARAVDAVVVGGAITANFRRVDRCVTRWFGFDAGRRCKGGSTSGRSNRGSTGSLEDRFRDRESTRPVRQPDRPDGACCFVHAVLRKRVSLPITFALLLSFLLSPVVRVLVRLRIPPPLGAGLIILAILGVLGSGAFGLSGSIRDWAATAPQTFATAETKLGKLIRPLQRASIRPSRSRTPQARQPAAAREPRSRRKSWFRGRAWLPARSARPSGRSRACSKY